VAGTRYVVRLVTDAPTHARRWPLRIRPLELLRLAAIGIVAFHALAFGLWGPGSDARIYYAADLADLYPGSIFGDTFVYSPAAAWWIQPLQELPFVAFRTLIVMLEVAGLVYMIGPIFAAVLLLAQFPPLWVELQQANINLALGAALVLGFRQPGWYAASLLTKVTPGVGLVWFAVRREWRALAIAAAVTLLIALPSLLLHFGAWIDFVRSLALNAELDAQIGAPLILRLALATAVIAWGGLTNRPWTVLVGAALAAHVNSAGWLVVLGVVRLLADRSPTARPQSSAARADG
jgi:Glycosyltransferase family 87